MILRGNVFSKILGMDTGITIVTPVNYKPEGNYKVVYLFHGLCGDSATWTDFFLLPKYARSGSAIYVMPEVGRSYYTDMKYGLPYFSYVTEELPAICQSYFNISSKREDTAVIGASMGGYGALKAALSKPEQYGMCAAFASSCLYLKKRLNDHREHRDDPEFIKRHGKQLLDSFLAAFGPDLDWTPDDELLDLAGRIPEAMRPVLYTTCGTLDKFLEDNRHFATDLLARGFSNTFEEWQGKHDYAFFDESLSRAIRRFGL